MSYTGRSVNVSSKTLGVPLLCLSPSVPCSLMSTLVSRTGMIPCRPSSCLDYSHCRKVPCSHHSCSCEHLNETAAAAMWCLYICGLVTFVQHGILSTPKLSSSRSVSELHSQISTSQQMVDPPEAARVVQLVDQPVERKVDSRQAGTPHAHDPNPDRHPPESATADAICQGAAALTRS